MSLWEDITYMILLIQHNGTALPVTKDLTKGQN